MRLPNLAATAAVLAMIAIVGGITISPRLGGGSIPSLDTTPSASPSPSALASPSAVASRRPAQNGAIAVVLDSRLVLIDPATGEVLKVLIEKPTDENAPIVATDLAWAPDGGRLAFAATGGVWVMDVSDAMPSRQIVTCGIDANACSIAWSPDGSRIAVAQAGRLELVNPDGDNRTVVHEEQGMMQPVWSPDGRRIAFQIIGGNPVAQLRRLVTIQRDGSDRTELIGPLPGIGVWDPTWSPDGSTIAYLGSTDVRVCDGSSTESCHDEWDLHVMAIDLNAPEPRELARAGRCFCLGFAPGLDWSPDGTSLAFSSLGGDGIPQGDPTANDGDSRLLVVNADGTGLRYLAAQAWGSPAWQPVPAPGP